MSSGQSHHDIGQIVQAYVHAKWAAPPDERNIARLGALLDPALRDRIDALGCDGERLLNVHFTAALPKLEALEREAAEEDARAGKAAASLRAEEERAMERRSQGVWQPTAAASRRSKKKTRQPRHRSRGRS